MKRKILGIGICLLSAAFCYSNILEGMALGNKVINDQAAGGAPQTSAIWEREKKWLHQVIRELKEAKRSLNEKLEELEDKISSYEECLKTMNYWSNLKEKEEG